MTKCTHWHTQCPAAVHQPLTQPPTASCLTASFKCVLARVSFLLAPPADWGHCSHCVACGCHSCPRPCLTQRDYHKNTHLCVCMYAYWCNAFGVWAFIPSQLLADTVQQRTALSAASSSFFSFSAFATTSQLHVSHPISWRKKTTDIVEISMVRVRQQLSLHLTSCCGAGLAACWFCENVDSCAQDHILARVLCITSRLG